MKDHFLQALQLFGFHSAASPKTPLAEEMSNTGEISALISGKTSTFSDRDNLDMHIIVTDDNNNIDGEEDSDDGKPSVKKPIKT